MVLPRYYPRARVSLSAALSTSQINWHGGGANTPKPGFSVLECYYQIYQQTNMCMIFFVVITAFVTFFMRVCELCAILLISTDLFKFFPPIIETGCILLEVIKWRHFIGSRHSSDVGWSFFMDGGTSGY